MSRLRYNGLKATLGGSLTNSATSVTFSAALTHSGGTNVPTISGTDYIPLTLLDSSDVSKEVVYLTAYTSGATTGTISRGKEGTSGAAHSSGATVVQAPTVGDSRRTVASAVRTAGDLSFNTTGWQDVSTSLDLTLADVVEGDWVEFTPSLNCGATANQFVFDVCTVVSGSPVNYFGTAGGSTENGVAGWLCVASASSQASGSAFYQLQAGDISSGSVTLRLRVRPSTTTARVISGSSLTPLRVWARVL